MTRIVSHTPSFGLRGLVVVALAAVVVPMLAGCPSDVAATDTAATTEPPPDPDGTPTGGDIDPAENLGYREILGGTILEGEYRRVRVGHIDARDAQGCCADYVLAGPGQPHVRVLFGAANNGLVFLAEAPDQFYDLAPAGIGLDDLDVLDVNGDGFADVVALRSDSVVAIRHSTGATAPTPVLAESGPEVALVVGTGQGRRSLAATDLNCDGKVDLVATSPDDASVVAVFASAQGEGFTNPFRYPVGASPRQLVVADVNGDARPDIITGNANGTASVLLGTCSVGFADPANYLLFVEPFDTPEMQVAVGNVCIGQTTKDWPAIALGDDDNVWILCGNSKGTFDAIKEEPSAKYGSPVDYILDSNRDGKTKETVFQLQYWAPTQTLYVLWTGPTEIVRFNPSAPISNFDEGTPVARLYGRTNKSQRAFALHHRDSEQGPHWTQIVRLVPGGDITDISFAR